MMKKNNFLLLRLMLTIFIFSPLALSAQLRMELLPNNPPWDISIFESPLMSAKIKVTDGDTPVDISINNIIILEENTYNIPKEVTLQPDGWYLVKWHSSLKGFREGQIDPFSGLVVDGNYAQIIYFNDVEAVSINGVYPIPNFEKILLRDSKGQTVEEIKFGTLPAGSETIRQINVNAYKGRKNSSSLEMPIKIDSVSLSNPSFRYLWQGNAFNQTPPPVVADIGTFNLVDLYFKPQSDKYYRDVFTVYYGNGLSEKLYLLGNEFPIENNTIMKLIQPVGGEILSPCQYYPIKWKGYVRGIPTKVQFSPNGGYSWTDIGSGNDSLLNWYVPKVYTQNGLIKIKQEFTSTGKRLLANDQIPVEKIAFDKNGIKLLSANISGLINEWDADKSTKLASYAINQPSIPFSFTNINGISYLEGDSSFVVCYNVERAGKTNYDSLAYFRSGNPVPYKKIAIDTTFHVSKMLIDSKKKIAAFIPKLGTTILLHSAESGEKLKYISYPYPIQTMAFNPVLDSGVVYLMNGEARLFSLPEFKDLEKIDLNDVPLILEMGLSPNGKLLAIGTKAPRSTAYSTGNNEIHIVDLESKMIVRTLRANASDPIGLEFSPASTILVIGSKAQPQIAFWDLPYGNYIGSLGGSTSELTDFKFSPEGHTVAIASSSTDNLILQSFTYPEEVISPAPFSIIEPTVELKGSAIEPAYLASSTSHTFTQVVCNTSKASITYDLIRFKNGTHFRLLDTIYPITINPGQCIDLKFAFNPLDTGRIADTILFISWCMGEYQLPVESYGLMRHLPFVLNSYDFGELCVGESIEKEFPIIRNDDPVPVKINSIQFEGAFKNSFELAQPLQDTILQPGEILKVKLKFKPMQTGALEGKIIVYHSDQNKFINENEILGFGLGTFLDISHKELFFIPEILTRSIKITNTSNNKITIEQVEIDPPGNFSVLTQLPVVVMPGESLNIEVKWDGINQNKATMTVKATPCVLFTTVYLDFYKATSQITIPVVQADPRGDAEIPIIFSNVENGSYRGTRFFESEIRINPRLFLPLEIASDYGTATILRNEIIGDRRYIAFRVEGDFPSQGTVARIKGVAGIAETDTSSIDFTIPAMAWGSAVETSYTPGLLQITGLCGDRRILQPAGMLTINQVEPNPTADKANVIFESLENTSGKVEIINALGIVVRLIPVVNIAKGTNSLALVLNDLAPGAYRIAVSCPGSVASVNIAIIR